MAFVDGIAGRLLPSDLACPRCAGGPALKGVEHEGFRADLCLKCRGAWFGLGMLEEVIRSAAKRKVRKGEGEEGPVHGGVETVRYAQCPRCKGGMARVPFCQRPLVIIDRCPSHGEWCDGGELAQLKTVARSRGVDEALGRAAPKRSAPPADKGPDADRKTDALMEVLRNRPGNWGIVTVETTMADSLEEGRRGRYGLFGRRRRRGRLDLFDILGSLLDL
jgi:Zn-finger nucleic acid-binding protein